MWLERPGEVRLLDYERPSREELATELASVRLAVSALEREQRLYRRLHFSTEVIENRLRALRRKREQLTATLERLAREESSERRRSANAQRTPSPSN